MRGWVCNSATFALDCWTLDILSDPNFFIEENKGVLVLKKDHHEGHFTNCQLQMGLCGASFCDIAVFVFNGMIIM